MLTNEEKDIFYIELYKLNQEAQKCSDLHLKSQIKNELLQLHTILINEQQNRN